MSAGAAALAPFPTKSISTAGHVVLLLALPSACLMAGILDVEAYLGFLLLASAFLIVLQKSRQVDIGEPRLILLFFASAICHAATGYWMAPPASVRIWIGNAAPRFYASSFLVIASGLAAAAAGYAVTADREFGAIRRLASNFDVDDRRFLIAARVIVILGAAMMLVIYQRMDFAPLMSISPGQTRYFTSVMGDEYAFSEWLVARSLDLLMFGIPLLLISGSWRKYRYDLLLGGAAFLVMLLPLRRANALSVPFVLLVMGSLRSGKVALRRGAVALLLVAIYGLSQMLISAPGNLDLESSVVSLGTALPEVRDLGWTIELLDGQRLHGMTFVQALTPVPSFLSDFSQRESLRAVTSRLIGLDAQRTTGGLRLTLAGEAFLNFDYFGPVALGFLFGVACSVVRVLSQTLRFKQSIAAYYLAAVIFVWVCFWIYLGGTQAAATVKMGTLLLAVSFFFGRKAAPAVEVAA